MMSGENPPENTGKGSFRMMPIISQCPVTESFPADASAMRPTAPLAMPGCAAPPSDATRPRPSARSVGTLSGTRARDVPERVASPIAVLRRVRQFADADAVEHDDDGSLESRG